MLSIGEFSNICKVSAKTLRYYEKIGLILPNEINVENGYRYYSIEQLETMLLIERLKSYQFSLEEIKSIIQSNTSQDELLHMKLLKKKKEIQQQIKQFNTIINQLDEDIVNLQNGKSIMSYLKDIDVQLTEVKPMNILSIRKNILEENFPGEYIHCFHTLLKKITDEKLTITIPPMVLFHNSEYTPLGLDSEFAVGIKEIVTGTRTFNPGLCLKTTLHGSYSNLTSVYSKQITWANKEGYKSTAALFEIYVADPSQVKTEDELITEVYYPVMKIK